MHNFNVPTQLKCLQDNAVTLTYTSTYIEIHRHTRLQIYYMYLHTTNSHSLFMQAARTRVRFLITFLSCKPTSIKHHFQLLFRSKTPAMQKYSCTMPICTLTSLLRRRLLHLLYRFWSVFRHSAYLIVLPEIVVIVSIKMRKPHFLFFCLIIVILYLTCDSLAAYRDDFKLKPEMDSLIAVIRGFTCIYSSFRAFF